MKKLSSSHIMKIIARLLILLAVAKVISLGAWWYLPSDGQELSVKNSYQPKYQRVDFKNMIDRDVAANTPHAKKEETTNSGISITNMILKGLYGTKTKGYVIVAMKSSAKKTSIVGIGEKFKGFTLKSISINSALFQKGGKDYILELAKSKKPNAMSKAKKKSTKDRVNIEEPIGVTRADISHYAKNPKQIWKEISIKEVKNGKKIKGFRVTKIDAKSKFAALGLQKGDLIIKANNVELKSYRDALEIYKNIDKLDTIQIVVMRNNQETELVYEIN